MQVSADGNQKSKAGPSVILTTTRFQVQSGLYLALETSFFCLETPYLVNLNIILRILVNQNQTWDGKPQIFTKFTFHRNKANSPSPSSARGFPNIRSSPWSILIAEGEELQHK